MVDILKIGFVGTRIGLNIEQKKSIIHILDKAFKNTNTIIVLHGDCIGGDTEFHQICTEYNNLHKDKYIEIHIYPTNITSMRAYNKANIVMPIMRPLDRNNAIMNKADILIACPEDKNVEKMMSATWYTIRRARDANMPIYLF